VTDIVDILIVIAIIIFTVINSSRKTKKRQEEIERRRQAESRRTNPGETVSSAEAAAAYNRREEKRQAMLGKSGRPAGRQPSSKEVVNDFPVFGWGLDDILQEFKGQQSNRRKREPAAGPDVPRQVRQEQPKEQKGLMLEGESMMMEQPLMEGLSTQGAIMSTEGYSVTSIGSTSQSSSLRLPREEKEVIHETASLKLPASLTPWQQAVVMAEILSKPKGMQYKKEI